MIKEKLNILKARTNPIKHIKYTENEETATHLTKARNTPKKEYEYYICDYCKEEIVLTDKKENRDGGIVAIPSSLSKTNQAIVLALHNRCLNKVLNELEPERVAINN